MMDYWTNTGHILIQARIFRFYLEVWQELQTAAVAAGGSSPPTPNTTSTEEFNNGRFKLDNV